MLLVAGGVVQAHARLPCCPVENPERASLEGAGAPALSLADLQGAQVALAELRGKVVVLNFWKGGLLGSQGQIPQLSELQGRYGTDHLRVLGVAMDERAVAAARKFAEQRGLECAVLLGEHGVAEEYSLLSLPTTLVIDQEGVVAKQYDGRIAVAQVEDQVRTLLQGDKKVETPTNLSAGRL